MELSDREKVIKNQIIKAHDFYSKKDRYYRRLVRAFKVIVLLLALVNTIILGLGSVICYDIQIIIGVVASALISFFTAISAYFNFESYWMRNIQIHVRLNILRDDFEYYLQSKSLDDKKIERFRKDLKQIQESNITYWEKAMRGV